MSLTTSTGDGTRIGNTSDRAYESFLERVQARFLSALADGRQLFTTDADHPMPEGRSKLVWSYLSGFPAENAQYHTCNACFSFIRRFGNLVTINDLGQTRPLFWDPEDAPSEERQAIAALARTVRAAKVTGPFLSSEEVWGSPVTGDWRHLAVFAPATIRFKHPVLTAGQVMAARREDFKNVRRALTEFKTETLRTALKLLETDSLYRAEKVIGPVKWLADLQQNWFSVNAQARDNVIWRAIAEAPAGFCHPRASMAGTLIEDIAAGMDFDAVSKRFAAKMHPLQYSRPQAAPAAGAIVQAEKLVEQLGIAPSLRRRYARLDEIETVWKPREQLPSARAAGGGVFGHLKPKGAPEPVDMKVPPITLTWDKFSRTALPTAEQIEIYVGAGHANFAAFVTAAVPDAPPIFQWDREEKRNPFSWYLWTNGAPPRQFNLEAGWHPLTAVSLQPPMWSGDAFHQHGKGVLMVIKGAKDTKQAGLALFPESMRGELHQVRSVIEAHSKSGVIEGAEEASVAGILLQAMSPARRTWDIRLRVTSSGGTTDYYLDRWD